ncbi:TIM barrel protein [Bermanella marisrubri]|uniref:Hydroxypyruvate isomerase n=1 Tax=Bermanella marisrubri TaxID=207949 RepID=Q1MZZ2_9GAMM|nr:TIM barrel protein [Bermanella marisrubri]EAT11571.1 hydroxypyruvate isomerase [Oceanobacter sp. RED65] [Bermanella marisrubri]QIZ84967.1 TIM barrel protein [Bermanella marisrubri]
MRLAANLSLMFTEVPLLQRFQKAKDAGFKTVEIQFPYEEKIEDLVKAKEAANVDVCLINLPAGDLMQGGEGLACVPGKEKEFEEAIKLGFQYAKALGVKCVNVLPGRCDHAGEAEVYTEVFKKNLVKAASALAKHHILVVFEAINTKDMPGFLIHNTQQMLDVLTELDHPNIKMQFDVYHMHIMDGNVDEQIRNHGHLIGHIQFADYPGRGEPLSGNLNFKSLFNDIQHSHYKGYVAAEYKPTGKTEDSLAWMENLDLDWLQTQIEVHGNG